MTCSTPCFGHTHRQGRGCECDAQATRDALEPFWQRSGGARVHNGVGFHFDAEDEAADEPIDTPEAAEGRAYAAWSLVCILATLCCWAIAIYRFTH